MTQISSVESDLLPASVLPAYRDIAGVVGSDRFYRTVRMSVQEHVAVDRFYLFDGRGRASLPEALFEDTEADKPLVPKDTYERIFFPVDPIRAGIEAALDRDVLTCVRVRPADIVVPAYRSMLERSHVVDRTSFVGRHGRGWRCMTVVRREQLGPFTDLEIAWLGACCRLLTPLVDRHRELVGEIVVNRVERLQELEERFANRYPDLTPRERQVCARGAIGMSIEGAALDLGVATSSILTYRKRAYQRLNVSSAYELARLVMR